MARFFGIPVAPDSFLPYCISFSVGLQVLFLPILGAIADYSHMRKRMMQIFATIGAIATILMFFITADLWWLGGVLFILANLAFGAAIVFYNAYLPDIASEDQRDRVSSYGWAMGYLGGGLCLLLNLAFFMFSENLGVPRDLAVRINLASAGVWWLGFPSSPGHVCSHGMPPARFRKARTMSASVSNNWEERSARSSTSLKP